MRSMRTRCWWNHHPGDLCLRKSSPSSFNCNFPTFSPTKDPATIEFYAFCGFIAFMIYLRFPRTLWHLHKQITANVNCIDAIPMWILVYRLEGLISQGWYRWSQSGALWVYFTSICWPRKKYQHLNVRNSLHLSLAR